MTVEHPDPAATALARGRVTGEDIEAVRRTMRQVLREQEARACAEPARHDREAAVRWARRSARNALSRRP